MMLTMVSQGSTSRLGFSETALIRFLHRPTIANQVDCGIKWHFCNFYTSPWIPSIADAHPEHTPSHLPVRTVSRCVLSSSAPPLFPPLPSVSLLLSIISTFGALHSLSRKLTDGAVIVFVFLLSPTAVAVSRGTEDGLRGQVIFRMWKTQFLVRSRARRTDVAQDKTERDRGSYICRSCGRDGERVGEGGAWRRGRHRSDAKRKSG